MLDKPDAVCLSFLLFFGGVGLGDSVYPREKSVIHLEARKCVHTLFLLAVASGVDVGAGGGGSTVIKRDWYFPTCEADQKSYFSSCDFLGWYPSSVCLLAAAVEEASWPHLQIELLEVNLTWI